MDGATHNSVVQPDLRTCARAEMGPVALAGEPVRLRDQLRHDRRRRLAVHARARQGVGDRQTTDGRLRLGAQPRQHRRRAQPHPRELQTGPPRRLIRPPSACSLQLDCTRSPPNKCPFPCEHLDSPIYRVILLAHRS